MENKLKARIDVLKKSRDEFIIKANAELAALNAAIGELEAIIAPEIEHEEGKS